MIALLYEAMPTFYGTWIECLGDLGRYRMAIEDDDIRDRDVWTESRGTGIRRPRATLRRQIDVNPPDTMP